MATVGCTIFQVYLCLQDPEASLSNLQKLVFSTTGVRTQHQRLVVEGGHSLAASVHPANFTHAISLFAVHQHLVEKAGIFAAFLSTSCTESLQLFSGT